MPARRGARRTPARPEAPRPAESGSRGVLDHTARQRVDPADLGGSAGAPSGPVRASGRSPSIRAGAERGLLLAGTGAAVGLAVGLPRVFGGGSGGGLLDDVFGDGKPEPKGDDEDGGSDGSSLFDAAGEALGVNPGFLVLVVGAGTLIYLWRRQTKAGA